VAEMRAFRWTAVVLIRCWYSLSGTPGTTRSETVALSSGSGVGQSVTMAVIAAAMAPTLRRAVLKRSSRCNIGLGVAGGLDGRPARRPLACLALFLVIQTPLGQFRRKSSLIPGESRHVSVTMRVILLPVYVLMRLPYLIFRRLVGTTTNPDGRWTTRQIRNLVMDLGDRADGFRL
jgi:hypothetical protein